MEVPQAIGLLGIYLTIMSILLIYKMFRLQTWIEAVNNIDSEIENSPERFQGAGNRERRRKTKEKIKNLQRKYPTLIDRCILGFIIFLSILGIYLSWVIRSKVNVLFTVVPVSIFAIIILISSIIFIINGKKKLKENKEKLDKWEE